MQNFIDVVRSRKTDELYGPIEEGEHLERALPPRQHLAPDRRRRPARTRSPRSIKSDAKLSEAYGRMVEHLHANNVDLSKTPLTLGVPLIVDAQERAVHRRQCGACEQAADGGVSRAVHGAVDRLRHDASPDRARHNRTMATRMETASSPCAWRIGRFISGGPSSSDDPTLPGPAAARRDPARRDAGRSRRDRSARSSTRASSSSRCRSTRPEPLESIRRLQRTIRRGDPHRRGHGDDARQVDEIAARRRTARRDAAWRRRRHARGEGSGARVHSRRSRRPRRRSPRWRTAPMH